MNKKDIINSLFLFFFLNLNFILHAQDIKYLEGIPSPENVANQVSGNSLADPYSKKIITLLQIKRVILFFSLGRGPLPEEQRVQKNYENKIKQLYQEFRRKSNNDKSLENNYIDISNRYQRDETYHQEILKEFLSPSTYNYYESQEEIHKAKVKQSGDNFRKTDAEKKSNEFILTVLFCIGVIAAFIAIVLLAIKLVKATKGNLSDIFLDHKGNVFYPFYGVKKFNLVSQVGRIKSHDKQLETIIEAKGGGGFVYKGTGFSSPVNVSSKTIVRDYLTITDNNGNALPIKLIGFDIICDIDDKVIIYTAFKSFLNFSAYVGVFNQSTNIL